MEVAVSALRADLKSWLERAKEGEEVVVTDRGVPIARLMPVDSAPLIERLTREGILGRPGRPRRRNASEHKRVRASAPVSELVSEQR